MKTSSIIQKTLAFAMLLIFTFSITPKKYLHELVADHQDFFQIHSGDEPCISQTGVNCHCEEVVVSTPFIEAPLDLGLSFIIFYKEYTSSSYQFSFLNTNKTKDSRGPPSMA